MEFNDNDINLLSSSIFLLFLQSHIFKKKREICKIIDFVKIFIKLKKLQIKYLL